MKFTWHLSRSNVQVACRGHVECNLAGMNIIETRLEHRDGGVWLVGICPGCWEHVAVRTPPNAQPVAVICPNGHELRVRSMRSEGLHQSYA